MKRPMLSRRDMLLASAAVALTAGVGLLTDRSARAEYIAKSLPRLLPGVQIDPETYPLFEREALAHTYRSIRIAAFASTLIGRELTTATSEGKAVLEEFDRIIVNALLAGTDLATRADPTDGPLVYAGWPPACGNPFYRPLLDA